MMYTRPVPHDVLYATRSLPISSARAHYSTPARLPLHSLASDYHFRPVSPAQESVPY